MRLEISHLSCGYRKKPVLRDISFAVETGECLCLLGPNGVGKTTLFKTVLGLLPPLSGQITVDGEDISGWPEPRRAKIFGYVPQYHTPPFAYSVLQIVTMGRVAHMGMSAAPDAEDVRKAMRALELLGIERLAQTPYTQISGGERQMALIARALAQEAKFLLMDEPTANLDYGNQARVLREIRQLTERSLSIIMITHAPDQAFACKSSVLLFSPDRSYRCGAAEDILTEQTLSSVYGIPVGILTGTHEHQVVKGCVPLL